MSDSNDRKNLKLQGNIQNSMDKFIGRHSGGSETFTNLHPAASQAEIFGLNCIMMEAMEAYSIQTSLANGSDINTIAKAASAMNE